MAEHSIEYGIVIEDEDGDGIATLTIYPAEEEPGYGEGTKLFMSHDELRRLHGALSELLRTERKRVWTIRAE